MPSPTPPTPLPIVLDRSDPRPLGVQIADRVRDLITRGAIPVGTRLPSSRRLAQELGVSRTVTEQAWEQLLAEGWTQARHGSGTFVGTGPLGQPMRSRPARSQPRPPTAPLIDLGTGTPWIDPRHKALWRRAWREVSGATPPRGYDDARGLGDLREAIAERLVRTRGIAVTADDIRITAGTTAGLRQLLAVLPPGPIAIEDPGYRAAAVTAQSYGRQVVDLPAGEAVDDLGSAAGAYVTPAHQHPLGRVMSADHRLRLLAAARRAGTVLIEDDYDSEFRYDVAPVPALCSLDPSAVAYLGTASKGVLPELRLGWLVVPRSIRPAFDRYRERTHDTAGWPVQRAFLALLRDGYVDAVVRSARQVYAARAPRVVAALTPYATLTAPVAGMYATALLPRATAVRAQFALAEQGFRINLLSDYCRSSTLTGLVFGFGGVTDDELDRALATLGAVLSAADTPKPVVSRR